MAFVTSLPVCPFLSSSRPTTVSAFAPPIARFPVPRSRRVRPSLHMTTVSPASSTTSSTTISLETFLLSAASLGTVRFVCVSPGAVLETIGRLDYSLARFSTPRGEYLTLATEDKTFEVHVNVSKAAFVTMTTQKAMIGGHDIHVLRILDEDDAILLSVLLMWDPSTGPGNYLHGAVDEFDKLKAQYGARFALARE